MKIEFTSRLSMSKANKERLYLINGILEDYAEQGFTLTLRQLYYQLVSKDIIANNDKEYAKLSVLLKKGRMCGVVDWNSIEDRVRKPKLPYYVHDQQDAIKDTVEQYRLNRQLGQKFKIELWVEKDALSNVMYRVSSYYHVNLMVNRGYSSVSAMFDAYNRLNENSVILYFGDHDPSGIDMIRDIRERLLEFGLDVKVEPVALTLQQIKQYGPPPNPAKITDPRAKEYIMNYGQTSWELDALPPNVLMSLAETAIEKYLDKTRFLEIIEKEKSDIQSLKDQFGLE